MQKHSHKPRWLWPVFAAIGISVAGCAKTVTWQEEVQLSDGRVIVVERETLRAIGGAELAAGGSGTRPKERRIRLAYPTGSGKAIEWISTKTDSGLWPEDPLVLDIIDKQVVVMSVVPTSGSCATYSKYVLRDSGWREERLTDELPISPTNLLIKSGPDMPKFVDLEMKKKMNADIRYSKRFRRVGPLRTICDG